MYERVLALVVAMTVAAVLATTHPVHLHQPDVIRAAHVANRLLTGWHDNVRTTADADTDRGRP